jgi:hypothetical protein
MVMKYPGIHLKIPWPTFEKLPMKAMKYPGIYLKIPWPTFEKSQ